jgi:hypothetical protein
MSENVVYNLSMLERRNALRKRMIKRAGISVGARFIECAALDISETGARIYVSESDLVPNLVLWTVALCLPDGTTRSARRCWQSGSDIGFAFL